MGYDPAAHDQLYDGLGSGVTFAFGLVFLALAIIGLLSAMAFEEPQVTYTCNPEQPHLSVKECVR